MVALGGLFMVLVVVGVALLAVKLLISLALLPLKIGFGLVKLVLGIVIGIPLLICGAVFFAAAAIPVIIVGCILGIIALPIVAVAKAIF